MHVELRKLYRLTIQILNFTHLLVQYRILPINIWKYLRRRILWFTIKYIFGYHLKRKCFQTVTRMTESYSIVVCYQDDILLLNNYN